MDWQLAEAKNKFSEVVRLALEKGPQRITRRGDAVMVISEEEYNKLTGKKMDFLEFLMSGPDFSDLDLDRNKSLSRDIEF